MTSIRAHTPATSNDAELRLAGVLETAGTRVLRYGLVFLLLMWGAFKFTAFEAQGIKPLLEHSPLFSWLTAGLGLRQTSGLIGVVEITTGLSMATRRWMPRLSGWASVAAAGTFLVTLSFLITTPGALAPDSPYGGFLMKDIILLGAALFTAAEALSAARAR